MRQVYIICEGQTEMYFVDRLLKDHFRDKGLHLTTSNLNGVSRYDILKREIQNFCRHGAAIVTTMIDFYGLPGEFPGNILPIEGNLDGQIDSFLRHFKDDIDRENFIPNLIIHEYEGLLFSNPSVFAEICDERLSLEIQRIRNAFTSPEHINNSQSTAPSKRLKRIFPKYQKITDGINIALEIGLPKIREECPLFDAWLKRLEALPNLP